MKASSIVLRLFVCIALPLGFVVVVVQRGDRVLTELVFTQLARFNSKGVKSSPGDATGAMGNECEIPPVAAAGQVVLAVSDGRYGSCVVFALDSLTRTEQLSFAQLSRRRARGHKPLDLARIVDLPTTQGFLLMALAWRESRWNVDSVGDNGRSCGVTQVRTDLPGRPECAELLNAEFAFEWTTSKLDGCTTEQGFLRLSRYNGAGIGAVRYEAEVWRAMHLMVEAYETCKENP